MFDSYNDKVRAGDSICSCCGTRYTESKTAFARGNRRILIGVGEFSAPNKTIKHTTSVVQTQNGPITVKVRHVW